MSGAFAGGRAPRQFERMEWGISTRSISEPVPENDVQETSWQQWAGAWQGAMHSVLWYQNHGGWYQSHDGWYQSHDGWSQPQQTSLQQAAPVTGEDYPMVPGSWYLTTPWPVGPVAYPPQQEEGSWQVCIQEAEQLCCRVSLRGRRCRRRKYRGNILTISGRHAEDAFWIILDISAKYVDGFDKSKVCEHKTITVTAHMDRPASPKHTCF